MAGLIPHEKVSLQWVMEPNVDTIGAPRLHAGLAAPRCQLLYLCLCQCLHRWMGPLSPHKNIQMVTTQRNEIQQTCNPH
jgi:hypothetical protein